MKLHKFLLYTGLGAGVWNMILAAIGYFVGAALPKEEFDRVVNEWSHTIGLVFVGIFVLVILYLVYQGVRKPK